MKRIAIYAGSFDPPTNGHVDVLRRSFKLADKIIIAIGLRPDRMPLFPIQERLILVRSAMREVFGHQADSLEVITFNNLLIEKARETGASLLIRGLRDSMDLDYEMQLAGMNSTLAPDIQTVFLPASTAVRAITATLVRQIATMGGDVSFFVPKTITDALKKKINRDAVD
ncbi:MAG: pantetheine-phosphate adenylyltransferase [Candidatus Tokpelaia sp. JSC085]|nr:MAG: pantetheine-phosphate adenylyltransferase [Candidatus Tokpelaia sp. JSC085]